MFTFVHVNSNVPCFTIYLVTVTAEKAAKSVTAVQDCVSKFVRVTQLDIHKETSGHSHHVAADTDVLSQILLFH